MPQLCQPLTGDVAAQSFLADTCYERTSENFTRHLLHNVCHVGLSRLGLYPPVRTPISSTANDMCDWMLANTWIEPSLYDHDIPPSHVLPMHMYDGDLPWSMLAWCYDPHDSTKHRVLSNANKIVQLYGEKSERFLTKSICYDHLEVCWLCYNQVGNVYLIHHLQVRGSVRDSLTQNEKLWMYRYMLRQFARMVPERSALVAPDAHTLTSYAALHPELTRIPTTPFSRHVFGKSGFARTNQVPETALHPKLYFTKELDTSDQRYWIKTT